MFYLILYTSSGLNLNVNGSFVTWNEDVVLGGSRTVIDEIKSDAFGEVFPNLKYDKEDKMKLLYNVYGDDELFDRLRYGFNAKAVRTAVKELIYDYEKNGKNYFVKPQGKSMDILKSIVEDYKQPAQYIDEEDEDEEPLYYEFHNEHKSTKTDEWTITAINDVSEITDEAWRQYVEDYEPNECYVVERNDGYKVLLSDVSSFPIEEGEDMETEDKLLAGFTDLPFKIGYITVYTPEEDVKYIKDMCKGAKDKETLPVKDSTGKISLNASSIPTSKNS